MRLMLAEDASLFSMDRKIFRADLGALDVDELVDWKLDELDELSVLVFLLLLPLLLTRVGSFSLFSLASISSLS